jgi:threonylcarbamoyladenosine tRNA methylthiotransferase MtaB
MRRRYNVDDYKHLISRLNQQIPDIGIGVDVIVGFPNETDARFENTFNFLEALPVSYLHVFTYSERKNTFAVTLPERVDIKVRKERSRKLRELSEQKRNAFYLRNKNKVHKVLFETVKDDGFINGFTENYIKVRTSGSELLENKILDAVIIDVSKNNIAYAEIITS